VTNGGGSFGEGTFFRVDEEGVVTTLFSFYDPRPLGPSIEGRTGDLFGISSRRQLFRLDPGVTLQVQRLADGMVLSWPRAMEGFGLEYTERLLPAEWRPTERPVLYSNFYLHTNLFSDSQRYFRLVRSR